MNYNKWILVVSSRVQNKDFWNRVTQNSDDFHNQPDDVEGRKGCTIPCNLDGAVTAVVVVVDVVGGVVAVEPFGFLGRS